MRIHPLFVHRWFTGGFTNYCGLIFFFRISMVFLKDSFLPISLPILSAPWMIVVWSLPPKYLPIVWRGMVVMLRQRYITICLGYTTSLFLFWEEISRGVMPKWSDTTWIISYGVISLEAPGEIRSFKASSASSIVISFLSNLERATIFVRAPSNSLILDLMLVAIYLITSLSML